jgi:hypothetical protein
VSGLHAAVATIAHRHSVITSESPMSVLPSHAEIHARREQPCTLRYLSDAEGAAALDAVLSSVGERTEVGGYERFSLFFQADEGAGPRQGLYTVGFADGIRWDMFLVPVERVGTRIVYQACFNRSLPT